MMKTTKKDFKLKDTPIFYRTDSMNALHWIKNKDNCGVFVMNHVQEIRKYSDKNKWNHFPGTLNPADLPSRGSCIETMISMQWINGPSWLEKNENLWPSSELN